MAINLSKGQTVDLRKSDGGALSRVRLGLGWDAKTVTKKGLFGTKTKQIDIDLDASALICSGGAVGDVVYFGQLASKDGALHHTGDNLTGAGDGDDESIIVDLPKVHPQADAIYFVVNSYSGQMFSDVENAYVRVVDSMKGDEELARYSLSGGTPHTALVMAKLTRQGAGWQFTAIGHAGHGKTAADLVGIVQSGSL